MEFNYCGNVHRGEDDEKKVTKFKFLFMNYTVELPLLLEICFFQNKTTENVYQKSSQWAWLILLFLVRYSKDMEKYTKLRHNLKSIFCIKLL